MRLQLAGVDVGTRWRELAEYAHGHIDDHVLAFNEMHSMLALSATHSMMRAPAWAWTRWRMLLISDPR